MPEMSTDLDWEKFGKKDPYWAVLTQDEFKRGKLDDQARERFFGTGEEHVAGVMRLARSLVPGFKPASVLDFGCGVGRLVIPLARQASRVVGVDVSVSMLEEARVNCASQSVGGVELVQSDDALSRVTGTFDLVHTFIVVQHIPCERGLPLLRRLIDLIAPGGVGALHLTYLRPGQSTPGDMARWPFTLSGASDSFWAHGRGLLRAIKKRIHWLFSKRPAASHGEAVEMQMNQYVLNPVFEAIQAAGVKESRVEFTDHGGIWGMMLVFQKPAQG